jgi:hypothetical protein
VIILARKGRPGWDGRCGIMDIYMHARVLFTIILGLGVSRLLSGVARIVQHPKEYKVYWVHLVWSLFVFLYLIHFWWWEYRLQVIQQWTFPLYFFISMYAVIQYLLCVLLFPEEMADYNSFLYLAESSSNKDQGRMVSRELCDYCDRR